MQHVPNSNQHVVLHSLAAGVSRFHHGHTSSASSRSWKEALNASASTRSEGTHPRNTSPDAMMDAVAFSAQHRALSIGHTKSPWPCAPPRLRLRRLVVRDVYLLAYWPISTLRLEVKGEHKTMKKPIRLQSFCRPSPHPRQRTVSYDSHVGTWRILEARDFFPPVFSPLVEATPQTLKFFTALLLRLPCGLRNY